MAKASGLLQTHLSYLATVRLGLKWNRGSKKVHKGRALVIPGKCGGVCESRGEFTVKLMGLECRDPSLALAPSKAHEEPR